MEAFETRFERLELKYVITEPMADRIRGEIAPYCVEDQRPRVEGETQVSPDQRGYLVRSLYLDTPSLAFHRAKQRGDAERFKLRIRKYSGMANPVLELKERYSDIISKTRAVVDADRLRETVHGITKSVDSRPDAVRFVDRFARLALTTGAGPTLLVRYDREAHTSTVDEYARVTIDRRIAAKRTRSWDVAGSVGTWCELDEHADSGAAKPVVVLELKCQPAVPSWIVDLVRRYDLIRRSFSKYSIGIYMTKILQGFPDLALRSGGILRW